MPSTPFTFQVVRSGDISSAFAVNWVVVGTGTNPAATSDFDFGGLMPFGTVSFGANDDVPKAISIPVLQDLVAEVNKTFAVVLSSPTNGVGLMTAKTSAPGTIINDD